MPILAPPSPTVKLIKVPETILVPGAMGVLPTNCSTITFLFLSATKLIVPILKPNTFK